ncbi:GDSL esterase/lipase At2g04020-like [Durio zibethinus]|uniref:GDSL esterase/lipase At2g04020-like n=1 Tax=Durio zibethinus TaxID=66656 RepID=A0A6P6A562_DURZI|nr:GDSL esterase/lipase At2g04020-like [Durio zibethinus]
MRSNLISSNVFLVAFLHIFLLIHSKPLVPALYVFGDSLFDSGNNNLLPTVAKANYPPYGLNFGEHLTGTFTNGRTLPDFIDVVTVPPFIISKKSILKYLSLENINFDVPALYVFGDSYVDAGNNNYVHVPQIERNYTPYGIDFGGKPTGRYTNGRTVADFIAQIVGLPFPPPVLSLSKGDKRIPQTGINYACGFTGILEKFGKLFERMPSLKEQVDLFESTTKGLQSQFQSKESFSRYLSKSLFFINSVAYDLDIEWDGLRYFYDENYYTQLLIKDLSKHLQRLYQLGARKIVVNNASPIGCQPHLISGGFTDVRSSCCTEIDKGLTKPCLANVAPCKDRSSHVFFDPMHPSESMHFIWARRLLKDSSVSSPINLIQLIQS